MQSQDYSQFLYNSLTPETRKETSTDYRTVKLECSIVVNYEDTEQGNCCGNHKEDRKHSQVYRTCCYDKDTDM